MNTMAACFLLPIGIAVYVVFGGLRATFICDWAHTIILFIVIYCLAPFYWMIVSSLRPDTEIFDNSWWPAHPSLENYQAVFSAKNNFAQGLINSLIVSIIVTIVALAIATFASYALARLDFRGKGFLLHSGGCVSPTGAKVTPSAPDPPASFAPALDLEFARFDVFLTACARLSPRFCETLLSLFPFTASTGCGEE